LIGRFSAELTHQGTRKRELSQEALLKNTQAGKARRVSWGVNEIRFYEKDEDPEAEVEHLETKAADLRAEVRDCKADASQFRSDAEFLEERAKVFSERAEKLEEEAKRMKSEPYSITTRFEPISYAFI
jgi:chromosome segregation ATPase